MDARLVRSSERAPRRHRTPRRVAEVLCLALGVGVLSASRLAPGTASAATSTLARECAAEWPQVVRAELIFVGAVESVTEHPERAALRERLRPGARPLPSDSADLPYLAREARFAVDSTWGRADSSHVTVFTDESSEGVPFEVGERFFVVAVRTPSGRHLTASVCSGSTRADESSESRDAYRLGAPRAISRKPS